MSHGDTGGDEKMRRFKEKNTIEHSPILGYRRPKDLEDPANCPQPVTMIDKDDSRSGKAYNHWNAWMSVS